MRMNFTIRFYRWRDQGNQISEIEKGQHGIHAILVALAHVAVCPVGGIRAHAAMVLGFGRGKIRTRGWGEGIGAHSGRRRARSREDVDGIEATAKLLADMYEGGKSISLSIKYNTDHHKRWNLYMI